MIAVPPTVAPDWYHYGSLAAALLATVLYVASSVIIVRHGRTFSSSYYKLYVLCAIVNTVTFWNSVVALRLPVRTCSDCLFASVFESLGSSFPVKILYMLLRYCGFLQYTIDFIMSFNRFTAVLVPFRHAKIWSFLLVPVMATILLLPMVIMYANLIYPAYFLKSEMSGVYGLFTKLPPETLKLQNYALFITCFTAFLLNLGINLYVLYRVTYKRKVVLKLQGGKDELRLVFHNLVSFVAQAFSTLATCLLLFPNTIVTIAGVSTVLLSCDLNIITYWNSVIIVRMPNQTCFDCFLSTFYDFSSVSFLTSFIVFGIGYYAYLQYTSSTLRALNRFTAVFFPFKHSKIWAKALLPVLLITIFFPLIFQYEYLLYESYLYRNNATQMYAYGITVPLPSPRRTIGLFSCCFGAFLINVVLNSCVLYKIIYQRSRILKQKGGKMEVTLVIHNLISFFGEAFASVVTFMLLFRDVPSVYSVALDLVPYTCDAVSLPSALILVICNQDLRTKILGMFYTKKEIRIVSITNSSPNL